VNTTYLQGGQWTKRNWRCLLTGRRHESLWIGPVHVSLILASRKAWETWKIKAGFRKYIRIRISPIRREDNQYCRTTEISHVLLKHPSRNLQLVQWESSRL
jgi:hypothetical protein